MVQTIGNTKLGGNKGGLFSESRMEIFSVVSAEDSCPTKSGMRTQRTKRAIFWNVKLRDSDAVTFIFENKISPPLVVYSVEEEI